MKETIIGDSELYQKTKYYLLVGLAPTVDYKKVECTHIELWKQPETKTKITD